MRTTLTLDPELATKLKKLAHDRQSSFKDTVNDVLRRGLAAQEPAQVAEPFVVEPNGSGFKPGIDPARLNQLLDELDTPEFSKKARSGR